MEHILLIGGAGYVGSVIVRYFLDKNYKVSVLDNLIYENYFSMVELKKIETFVLFCAI
ncbi:uncharacterized protein METZ01_LOCUS462072 [marine metagenome]|uniref:NAD-dependent epimerase/dehydratase domain-containing protein n=1 Tax=marine metagenome TaxID=408172 RepID=A0A383AQ27_9ZZZZ